MCKQYIKFYLVLSCLLAACSHQSVDEPSENQSDPNDPYAHIPPELRTGNEGRYHVDHDYHPVLLLNPSTIVDAIPRHEPIKKAGNKNPYTVLGKTYHLLPTAKGYDEKGGASWYGLKFHGHKTSNGETYSIYAMTAAHKTLPIPSYVRVTNLANNKQVIVRVNDRGPFHEGRIIDLSYAAATKLDYISTGTAQVRVEAIDPDNFNHPSRDMGEASQSNVARSKPALTASTKHKHHAEMNTSSASAKWYVQVAAYSRPEVAKGWLNKLKKKLSQPVRLLDGEDGLYRLQIGPLQKHQVNEAVSAAKQQGFDNPSSLLIQ